MSDLNIDDKGFGSPLDGWDIAYALQDRQYSQDEVNYNPLGATGERGCANCQWFVGPDYCLLVRNWPQPITPNGLSDEWRERVIPEDYMKAKKSREPQKSFINRMVDRVAARLLKEDTPPEPISTLAPLDNNWFFTKGADGNLWWMAVATNNFRDNDYPSEIFTAKAHQDLMHRYDTGETPLPELWYWHTPGTRWGEAKMAGFDDGLVWYAGTVDPGMEHVAQKVAALAPYLRVSHGYRDFRYSDKARGIISEYTTFEVSPLPVSREANPLTAFAVSDKEMDMEISKDKRDHLVGIFGQEWVDGFEHRATALVDQGKAEGREQKDQTPAPDAAVVETPVTTPDNSGAVTPQPPQEPDPVPAEGGDQKAQTDALVEAMLNSPGFKALSDGIGTVAEAVKEIPALKQRMDSVEQQLKEGDEARMDRLIAAKVAVPPQGQAPTSKESNIVNGKEAEQYGAPNLGIDPAFAQSLMGATPQP